MTRSRPLAAAALSISLTLLLGGGALACEPAYSPPPKRPESVYIPWNVGPARGARRAAAISTAAPSTAPSVQLEELDGTPPAGMASSAPPAS